VPLRNRLIDEDLFPLDGSLYDDFLWEKLFATTLAAAHRRKVLQASSFAVHTGRRSAENAARFG
jgi:hypothetical protein